jgi:acetyl-CoA synthetase
MSQEIASHLKEHRSFAPSPAFQQAARISSMDEYRQLYQRSIDDPEGFWAEQAEQHLDWMRPWDAVLAHDFHGIGQQEEAYVRWFAGGQLNVSANCLDRHVAAGRGDQAAILWQGEDEAEKETITYAELLQRVNRFAAVLQAQGVKQGTTVTLFMPMVPALPVAMLACARLGAIHSVEFSAFSAEALRRRIQDCASEVVITADAGFHAGKTILLKPKVDEALQDAPTVQRVVVYRRAGNEVAMQSGRDVWWHEAEAEVAADVEVPPVALDAEDPLFILYTSGSTGKPKGVLHTTAGYLLHTHLTFQTIFDYRPGDLYWCTADIGWITGHSYLVYGPLSNGATTLMFEGVPTYPEPDRFWKIIAEYGVTIFYTAPTAIRALMRMGDSWPAKHDLSSLRLLGTVGEPINPEAWMWYYRVIGGERCPIVDTWWQTETGGIMITTLPGAIPAKPGSAGLPFFGVQPEILKDDGSVAAANEGGMLVVRKPWPGMIRGVYGDRSNALIRQVYFDRVPGAYFTGDGCRQDEDGYYWLLGRIDDVINVSAHRFATAEIESALVSHPDVAEAAVVGFPHDTKGQGIYCYVTLKDGKEGDEALRAALVAHVRKEISPIATPDRIHFTPALPKTRSGKIMRRILRKIADGHPDEVGDTSTLADPSVVDALIQGRDA